MANLTTNVDTGRVEIDNGEYFDGPLTLTAAATVKEGTILARDSASGKFVVFAVGGATNENGIPKAVMAYDFTASAGGDFPIRAIVRGTVNRDRLIVQAAGDGSTITVAHIDQLRDYGIVAVPVQQLTKTDNQ